MLFVDDKLLDLSLICITLFFLLYLFFTRNFNHWQNRGIPYKKPSLFFGNLFELFNQKKTISEILNGMYSETEDPCLGFFIMDAPALLIKDKKLVKDILVKDFNCFSDNAFGKRKGDLSYHMLSMMNIDEWKIYKQLIAPAFTQPAIRKNYFKYVQIAGDALAAYLERTVKPKALLNAKFISEMYSVELLTNVAMGIKGSCFQESHSEYLEASSSLLGLNKLSRCFSVGAYLIYPTLVHLFRLPFINPQSADFFRNIFWRSVAKKEKAEDASSSDFLDFLMNLKKTKKLHNISDIDEKLFAQALTLYVAGYEALTCVVTMTLYELAFNADIQNKLRKEIQDGFGKLESEDIPMELFLRDFRYLDMVLKESLRKYPPLPLINRMCLKNYTFEDKKLVIEAGTTVVVPLSALHMDPKHFPDPKKFIPERFSEENSRKIQPYSYIPFADGPRDCIGKKFGIIIVKYAIARIIKDFQVELRDESQKHMEFLPRSIIMAPKDEKVMFKFTKLSKDNQYMYNKPL